MERTHPVNIFVCECMTQSLFRLMKRKPYHEITVTDIVREAGVSRNSFYRNYQSIEEIITQFLEQRTSEWWNRFIVCPDRYPHVISEMFFHFFEHERRNRPALSCRTFISAHESYRSLWKAKSYRRNTRYIPNGLPVRWVMRTCK